MSKPLVFGQDVLITLASNDTNFPFVLDFDENEITSLRQNKIYKAIGKRISRTHSHTTGYKIMLSRAKRDNYLEALFQYLDFFLEMGLEPPLFSVKRSVKMTYNVSDINPNKEFFQTYVQADKDYNSFSKRLKDKQKAVYDRVGQFANAYLRKATQQFNQNTNGLVSNFNKVQNQVNNVKNLVDSFNPFSVPKSYEDSAEWKELQQMIKQHNESVGQMFKTEYIYQNCSLAEESFSDKVHENTIEKITLYASNRVNRNKFNEYDDSYLKQAFSQSADDAIKRNGYDILDNSITRDNSLLTEIINAYTIKFKTTIDQNNG